MSTAVPSLASPPDLSPWFTHLKELPPPPLALAAFFGNDRPVELEVGTGRGLFLTTAGEAHPDINFLGIECDLKEARRAATRFQKRQYPNVRLVGGDANVFLPRYLPAGSMQAVHVYFPDPWWKKRHRKRRIFNPAFVAECARLIPPGGLLHSWTDVAEYFTVICSQINISPAFRELPPPEEREASHDMDYHTSYERKKRKEGLPIYRARWERLPLASQ